MSETTKEDLKVEDKTRIALNKLAIILKIVFEDNQDIFLKKPEEVDVDSLKNLSESLISVSALFQEVIEEWFGSGLEGFDAIKRSEEFLDILEVEIGEADKLGFEQVRTIMNEINKIDEALESLEKISFYLNYYEDLCRQKGLSSFVNLSEIFRVYGIEEFTKILKNEAKRYNIRLERNNLYNNLFNIAKLNTKTLKIAYSALGISVVFAVVAVLDLLLRLMGH